MTHSIKKRITFIFLIFFVFTLLVGEFVIYSENKNSETNKIQSQDNQSKQDLQEGDKPDFSKDIDYILSLKNQKTSSVGKTAYNIDDSNNTFSINKKKIFSYSKKISVNEYILKQDIKNDKGSSQEREFKSIKSLSDIKDDVIIASSRVNTYFSSVRSSTQTLFTSLVPSVEENGQVVNITYLDNTIFLHSRGDIIDVSTFEKTSNELPYEYYRNKDTFSFIVNYSFKDNKLGTDSSNTETWFSQDGLTISNYFYDIFKLKIKDSTYLSKTDKTLFYKLNNDLAYIDYSIDSRGLKGTSFKSNVLIKVPSKKEFTYTIDDSHLVKLNSNNQIEIYGLEDKLQLELFNKYSTKTIEEYNKAKKDYIKKNGMKQLIYTLDENVILDNLGKKIEEKIKVDIKGNNIIFSFDGLNIDKKRYPIIFDPSLKQAQGNYSIPRDGLVGEWLLDGNTSDTVGTNNGTNTAVTFANTDIGSQSQSGVFNGSTSSVLIPSTPSISLSTSLSISIWVKQTAPVLYGTPLYKGTDSGALNINYAVNGNGSFMFVNGTWISTTPVIPFTLTNGVWTHFVVTHTFGNGAATKMYRDGVSIPFTWSGGTGNESAIINTSPIGLGTLPYYVSPSTVTFNGMISTTRIYNRVLSTLEVQTLYLEGQRQLGRGSYFGSNGLLRGLVAYYDMKGDATDIIGGNNGTVTGTTLTSDRFGVANSAYSFNGTTNYITIPSSPTLTTQDVTIGLWVKTTTTTIQQPLFCKRNLNVPTTFTAMCLAINAGVSGDFQFDIYDTADRYSRSTTQNINDGTWHFIVVTGNHLNNIELYKDGLTVSGYSVHQTTGFINSVTDGPLIIGSYSPTPSTNFYNGQVGEIFELNRALSADEVKALYEVSSKKYLKSNRNLESTYTTNANTVAYYKLNGNVLDSSGMGYHGTATGITYSQGAFGQGASFNGTTSDISLGNQSFGLTTNFTMSVWFKIPNITGRRILLSKWNATNSSFILWTNGNILDPYIYNAGYTQVVGTKTFSPSVWNLATFTYNGSNLSIYVNGQFDSTRVTSGSISSSAANTYLGKYTENTSSFLMDGSMDEIIIENRTWSTDQIRDYYNKSKYKFFE